MVAEAMKLKDSYSLEDKAIKKLDSILKSKDITLLTTAAVAKSLQLGPTKVHKVKAMVFPVVMYGCESWTIKKAEH